MGPRRARPAAGGRTLTRPSRVTTVPLEKYPERHRPAPSVCPASRVPSPSRRPHRSWRRCQGSTTSSFVPPAAVDAEILIRPMRRSSPLPDPRSKPSRGVLRDISKKAPGSPGPARMIVYRTYRPPAVGRVCMISCRAHVRSLAGGRG
jgi:hypothetical protein